MTDTPQNIFAPFSPQPAVPPQDPTERTAGGTPKRGRGPSKPKAPAKPARKARGPRRDMPQNVAAAPTQLDPRSNPDKPPWTNEKKRRGPAPGAKRKPAAPEASIGTIIAATSGMKPEEVQLFSQMVEALQTVKAEGRVRIASAMGKIFP